MTGSKRQNPVAVELERFLKSAELQGVDAVRGALARRLAEELDSVPPYALPRLAAGLVQLLEALETGAPPDAVREAKRLLRQVAP